MLEITVPANEIYHPGECRFINIPACVLVLEHSLLSVRKWEAKWHTPYLNAKRTLEQDLDYIRCMAVEPIENEYVFSVLSPENIEQIQTYMDDTMTATTFSKDSRPPSKKKVTAEILYCRMFANNIPMECQTWHLNSLISLIKVCEENNGPKQKMTKQETARHYAEQNALRKAEYNTKG